MRLSVCGGASGVPICRRKLFADLSCLYPSHSFQNSVEELLLRSRLLSVHAICCQSCVQAVDLGLGPRHLLTANLNLPPTSRPRLHYDRPASLTFVLI